MDEIVKLYKQLVVQIATPFSTGTGFILSEYGLIVTNEHVVRDNKSVVIELSNGERRTSEIIYLDQKFDLAFIKHLPTDASIKAVISDINEISVGETVIAIGHPLGLQFSITKGIISSLEYSYNDNLYIQHDAALNPGNSGGPLLNELGQIIGINSFIMKNGLNIGLALPIAHLQRTIQEFCTVSDPKGVRCSSCESIIFSTQPLSKYCKNCGDEIISFNAIQDYHPTGISLIIEDILSSMEMQPEICRRGLFCWEVNIGSARINISYHEKSGYIVLDAYLCKLAKENAEALYRYLLQQNYYNQGITFSLKNQNIILSIMIYDQYLKFDTAKKMFHKIFKAADHYDDVLVNNFGAVWVNDN